VAAKITSFLQSLPGQPASEAAPPRRLSLGQQIAQDVNRHVPGVTQGRNHGCNHIGGQCGEQMGTGLCF